MKLEMGERLKQAREKAGFKQNKVCEMLEIPKAQTLSAYERGVNNPSLETLAKLADLYHVSIDWIVCGKDFQCSKPKTRTDYIRDLFNAVDNLELQFTEETYWNGMPDDKYIIRLTRETLRGFDELITDLYRIYGVKKQIDDEDFESLVQKKINKYAAETNNFETVSHENIDRSLNDGDPPF